MIENRKSYRLPFKAKFLFGNETRVATGNTTNLSAGGAFVMTLDNFARDSRLRCVFLIDIDHPPIIIEGVVKRTVASSPNVDETPGIGVEFINAGSSDVERIERFMEENRRNFELASTMLATGEPDLNSLAPLMEKMHLPSFTDLGEFRFFVERILRSIEMVDSKK